MTRFVDALRTSAILVLVTITMSDGVSEAKMAFDSMALGALRPTEQIPIERVEEEFKKVQKRQALTPEQSAFLNLLTVSFKDLGLKTVSVYSSDSTAIQRLRVQSLIPQLTYAIQNQKSWEGGAQTNSANTLKANRQVLEQAIGAKTYPWAWFLYQMDEKSAAKALLSELYEGEFERIMKLKTATYGMGRGPMTEVEHMFNALERMCSPEEKTAVQSKMQKMKIHVSNLPESHIVT